ncbi:hypothetical protein HMPREF1563_3612, partial [Providencia alcalifaciens 205/92]
MISYLCLLAFYSYFLFLFLLLDKKMNNSAIELVKAKQLIESV